MYLYYISIQIYTLQEVLRGVLALGPLESHPLSTYYQSSPPVGRCVKRHGSINRNEYRVGGLVVSSESRVGRLAVKERAAPQDPPLFITTALFARCS